jgi:excisionase family DNA binding protein
MSTGEQPPGGDWLSVPRSIDLEQLDAADVHDPENLLDVKEAARLLNVTPSWVYEHCRPGVEELLPFVKIGKYLRFDRRDLRAYIDQRRRSTRRRER